MSIIKVTKLGGIFPSVLPRNLAPEAAQASDNLLAFTTEFRPIADDATVFTTLGTAANTAANPKSLYRFDRTPTGELNANDAVNWRSSASELSTVKTQLNDDQYGRMFYTNNSTDAPPRVATSDGTDRQLGVPVPLVKPTVTVNQGYLFTPENKRIEMTALLEKAVNIAMTTGLTMPLVGLAAGDLPAGWLMSSNFTTNYDARKVILRLFAVNPTTNAVISTYSSMLPSEAAWVFDPALKGFFATKPGGYTPPAWATGHTKWWVIEMRGLAEAYDIDEPVLSAALQTLDMPGTQGAQKLLSATEANTMAARLADLYDKDDTTVLPMIEALKAKQQEAANIFSQGGAVGLVQAVKDFYAKSDVTSALASSRTAYAELIWRQMEIIGTATATPYYQEGS